MKNKTVWSNRLKGKTSLSFQKIGSSISADKRLYEQDIAASIVHAKMLVKQKIIGKKEGSKIINGLKKIKSQIDKGKLRFQEKFMLWSLMLFFCYKLLSVFPCLLQHHYL